MKYFLAILIVALVSELSLAAPTHDADKKATSYHIAKEMMAYMMPRFASVGKQLPDTPAFSTYKADFNQIMEYYETENEDIFCFQKNVNIGARLRQHSDKLKADKSEEAKKILKLLDDLEDDTANNYLEAMKHAEHATVQEALEKC